MGANLPKDPDKRSRPILIGIIICVLGVVIWNSGIGDFVVWIAN